MDTQTTHAVATASALQSSTGFLDLSAELRNKIYRLALCADLNEGEFVELRWGWKDKTLYRPDYGSLQLTPGILASCKQVYSEAISILYGENAFAMCPASLIEVVPQAAGFTSHTRFLQLHLEIAPIDYFWLGNSEFARQNIRNAIRKMARLCTISLKGEIVLDSFEAENTWDLGRTMARGLRPVVVELMLKGSNVRELLKLEFSGWKWRTSRVGPIDDFDERINIMQEYVYQHLEFSMKWEAWDSSELQGRNGM